MVSDIGLIVCSIISLAGAILLYSLSTSTWFKKENFKIKKKSVMDENRIKIKKMERELGITGATKAYREPQTPIETGSNLLSVLKNLDGDQIQGLADKFLKTDDEHEYSGAPPSTIDSLLEFANNNPEVAEQFLKGVTGKKENTDNVFNS